MTRTHTGWLWVLSALLLVSCAAPIIDVNSPYYRMPVGTMVVLQQDLTVPAGNARVFLQGGKVVKKTRLDIYRPHCNFQQRTVSDGTAVIKADRFRVTAVSAGDDFVVQSHDMVYAAFHLAGDDGNITMITQYIQHELSSPSQPQVMRLTCHGGFDFPGRAQTPSLTDIRTALGGVATIELP